MTKEEILQKVNDYCTEKAYTTETLTDAFKDKFADHFLKANAESDINDEGVDKALKFALNTAFSSASELATVKAAAFLSKENDFKAQIAELQKKIPVQQQQQQQQFEIPEDLKKKLDELEQFKNQQATAAKFKNIMDLAKVSVHKDLHESFEKFAADYKVDLEKPEKEQAEALVAKYQGIMKSSYGNIKPLAPVVAQKQDEAMIQQVGKVTISN